MDIYLSNMLLNHQPNTECLNDLMPPKLVKSNLVDLVCPQRSRSPFKQLLHIIKSLIFLKQLSVSLIYFQLIKLANPVLCIRVKLLIHNIEACVTFVLGKVELICWFGGILQKQCLWLRWLWDQMRRHAFIRAKQAPAFADQLLSIQSGRFFSPTRLRYPLCRWNTKQTDSLNALV